MKLRLTPHKMVIRISESELKDLYTLGTIDETFWVSTKLSINVNLSFSPTDTRYCATESGFNLEISQHDLCAERNPKDPICEIRIDEKLVLRLEVDLFKDRNSVASGEAY